MGGHNLRIYLPMLGPWNRAKKFRPTHEGPHNHFTHIEPETNHIPRRHVNHGKNPRGGNKSSGHGNISAGTPGNLNKQQSQP